MLASGAILFPSLAVLFRLTLTGRLRAAESAEPEPVAPEPRDVRIRVLARVAAACLIAGVGLLNVATAEWAHAVGITFLFGFILTAFRAITHAALDPPPVA